MVLVLCREIIIKKKYEETRRSFEYGLGSFRDNNSSRRDLYGFFFPSASFISLICVLVNVADGAGT